MNFTERLRLFALTMVAAAWLAGCAALGSSPEPLASICNFTVANDLAKERIESFRRKLAPVNIDGAVVFLDNRPVTFLLLGSRDDAGVEHWFGTNGARMSIGPDMLVHVEGLPVDDFRASVRPDLTSANASADSLDHHKYEMWTHPLQDPFVVTVELVEVNVSTSAGSCCASGSCSVSSQKLSIGERRLSQRRIVVTHNTHGHIQAAVFPLADGYQILRFVRLSDRP